MRRTRVGRISHFCRLERFEAGSGLSRTAPFVTRIARRAIAGIFGAATTAGASARKQPAASCRRPRAGADRQRRLTQPILRSNSSLGLYIEAEQILRSRHQNATSFGFLLLVIALMVMAPVVGGHAPVADGKAANRESIDAGRLDLAVGMHDVHDASSAHAAMPVVTTPSPLCPDGHDHACAQEPRRACCGAPQPAAPGTDRSRPAARLSCRIVDSPFHDPKDSSRENWTGRSADARRFSDDQSELLWMPTLIRNSSRGSV